MTPGHRGPAAGGGDELLGEERLQRVADAALDIGASEVGVGGVEVVVYRTSGGLTRFANSQIHQNVWTEDVLVNVRVVTPDGRWGVAGVHADDPALVRAAAGDAFDIARVSAPDQEFPGLAPPADVGGTVLDEETVSATAENRAGLVRDVLAEVTAGGFEAAGAYQTGAVELAVATTTGQRSYSPVSRAELTLVVSGPTSSGFAQAGGRSAREVDGAAEARRAVAKAHAGRDATGIEPGAWPVVLEPPATGELVEFLSLLGFGGRGFLERRSFAAHRMGERIVDEKITITDDARSAHTTGFAVDFEGTPKQQVELVRDGVLKGVVHDRYTAARLETTSTGHGLMAPNTYGPVALDLVLGPGDGGGVDDLVGGLERGLLVTRFHYTNVVHPLETIITGMTRDGTFLVEDGQIRRAVHNLRFTDSILRALGRVDGLASETGYHATMLGGTRMPALALPTFHFTGATTFG